MSSLNILVELASFDNTPEGESRARVDSARGRQMQRLSLSLCLHLMRGIFAVAGEDGILAPLGLS